MRLVDKVVQGSVEQHLWDRRGMAHALPGAGIFAARVHECRHRYVLDRDASRQCASLFRRTDGLPDAEDPICTAPCSDLWIEFYSDGDGPGDHAQQKGRRMGLLVELEEGGRQGRVTCFGEGSADGPAQFLQCWLEFDLDAAPTVGGISGNGYRLRHGDLPAVDSLLGKARLHFSDQWRSWSVCADASPTHCVQHVASFAWAALPMLISFNALINSRGALRERRAELGRLNQARERRGRPPLLDHIEVSLDLGGGRVRGTDVPPAGQGTRSAPRLHLVRGHRVSRAGKVFWRSSHYRGETNQALSRTVRVSMRAGEAP